jgi:hypothetical protein
MDHLMFECPVAKVVRGLYSYVFTRGVDLFLIHNTGLGSPLLYRAVKKCIVHMVDLAAATVVVGSMGIA